MLASESGWNGDETWFSSSRRLVMKTLFPFSRIGYEDKCRLLIIPFKKRLLKGFAP